MTRIYRHLARLRAEAEAQHNAPVVEALCIAMAAVWQELNAADRAALEV